jgi:hypothetical protein
VTCIRRVRDAANQLTSPAGSNRFVATIPQMATGFQTVPVRRQPPNHDILPVMKKASSTLVTGCCDKMRAQLGWPCDRHRHPEECPDALVGHFPNSRRFGLYVHDGGSSFVEIHFCPWCGHSLAENVPPKLGRPRDPGSAQ